MSRYLEHCHAIDELLGLYAFVLDGQHWERWPELFAEDCYYGLFSIENVEEDLPLAYMLDDSRARILDRVKFVREVWACRRNRGSHRRGGPSRLPPSVTGTAHPGSGRCLRAV